MLLNEDTTETTSPREGCSRFPLGGPKHQAQEMGGETKEKRISSPWRGETAGKSIVSITSFLPTSAVTSTQSSPEKVLSFPRQSSELYSIPLKSSTMVFKIGVQGNSQEV